MNSERMEQIHNRLSNIVEAYIEAIKEEYGKYIPSDKLVKLNSISDYRKVIRIYDYGSINGYASDFEISMPLCADKVLKLFKVIPGFGINKNHMTHGENDLIINDNTFADYALHVFISGTDTEGYYEDMLLHETMHFCGSGGASALKEGINELMTRKLAFAKGFKTSACGYPKEVKVAYELQKIFGEDVLNQIAFINDEGKILDYLENTLGKDASSLYKRVSEEMEKEFFNKYYKKMDEYGGVIGIAKKIVNYKKINYNRVHKLIDDYKVNKFRR